MLCSVVGVQYEKPNRNNNVSNEKARRIAPPGPAYHGSRALPPGPRQIIEGCSPNRFFNVSAEIARSSPVVAFWISA